MSAPGIESGLGVAGGGTGRSTHLPRGGARDYTRQKRIVATSDAHRPAAAGAAPRPPSYSGTAASQANAVTSTCAGAGGPAGFLYCFCKGGWPVAMS